MTMRFHFFYSFSLAAVLMFVSGCQHPMPTGADSVVTDTQAPDTIEVGDDTVSVEAISAPLSKPEPAKPRKQQTSPSVATRQVYVTGYNSFGRLWGYVTMTGDHGTGEIHDEEENHYNVRCTRHGNELFAVDQNSRQYVLKISE